MPPERIETEMVETEMTNGSNEKDKEKEEDVEYIVNTNSSKTYLRGKFLGKVRLCISKNHPA